MLILCECGCGEEIIIKSWHKRRGIPKYKKGHNRRGKHFSEESKLKISNSKRGRPSGRKGIPHSEKSKLNMSLSKIGKHYSLKTEFKKGYGKGIKRPDFSNILKLEIGKNNRGWKGGVTPLYDQIRQCGEYINWRTQIFGRDNFTCQKCGVRGVYLEAHHIKRFSKIIKENNIKTLNMALNCPELWDLNNGITLCKQCHNKTKGRIK